MTKIKKILLPILLVALVASLFVAYASCKPPETQLPESSWTTTSPNGSLAVTLNNTEQGTLNYSVKLDETVVLDNSKLGFVLEEDNLAQVLTFVQSKTERVRGNYQNISGRNATVEYDCNQTTVTFSGSLYFLDVIIRSYDDGYAFRYNIRAMDDTNANGTVNVASEETTFALPTNSVMWMQAYKSNLASQGDFFSYEESYSRRRSDSVDNWLMVMPLMYRVGTTKIYSTINESDLIGSGYWGSFLQDVNSDGVGELKTVHNTAGAMEDDKTIQLPFTSPWRVASVGTMEQVQNSEIVEKVYDDAEYWRPDDYATLSAEEQAIYNYDWVEPGVAAWNWLIESSWGPVPQADWDMQYRYVELAAKMGWKYTILDGGWDQNMTKVTEFTQYANQKGVKVIAWVDAYADFAFGESVEALASKLALWKSWGIDGIKIDFFDGQTNPGKLSHQGEDSLTIEWYEHIYQECAKLKMVVNCHGCNKPTGERRIYPNVINREAIYGNELYPASGDSTVNNLFVRGNVGPTDFTPLVNPLRTELTKGHQMALAALYESGIPSMAGRDSHYTDDLADFYKIVPAERDQTIFLDGEPDEYYMAATRSGDSWIVACANAAALERTATVNFTFLAEGNYTLTIYEDVEGDQDAVNKTTREITNNFALDMTMVPSGGFVICVTPKI